jgi:hypothetical protein
MALCTGPEATFPNRDVDGEALVPYCWPQLYVQGQSPELAIPVSNTSAFTSLCNCHLNKNDTGSWWPSAVRWMIADGCT